MQRLATFIVEWIDYLDGWRWWVYRHVVPRWVHDQVFQRCTNKSIHNSWRIP